MWAKRLKPAMGVLLFVVLVAGLTLAARRGHYVCPACGSSKEVIGWRTLGFVELLSRDEKLTELPIAAGHRHNWHRQSYTQHDLLGLLFKGMP